MLCGEYHVLTHGAQALAFTLDTYLEVYVRYGTTARESLTLHSNLWDAARQINAETVRDNMLVATVCELMPVGEHKVKEIRVTSQLNPRYGFGSSSALRLALVFITYLQQHDGSLTVPLVKGWQLAGQAFALQKKSQQCASGYDVATQFSGGVVKYHSGGGEWPDLCSAKPLAGKGIYNNLVACVHLFIGGKGADTTIAMRDTKNWLAAQGDMSLTKVTQALLQVFTSTLHDPHSLPALVAATAQWRDFFSAAPHFPTHIAEALQTVGGLDCLWSWKTSGAGGEDALLVIGHEQDIVDVTACLAELGWQRHDYNVAKDGMSVRRI